MSKQDLLPRLEAAGPGWRLLGHMNFQSVPALLVQAGSLFDFAGNLQIDMAGVDHADSAGLALMLEWQERSRKASGSILFLNTPAALLNIARLCNVEELLPLASEAGS